MDFMIIRKPYILKEGLKQFIVASAWNGPEENNEIFDKQYKIYYEIIDKGTNSRHLTLTQNECKTIIINEIPHVLLPLPITDNNMKNALFDIKYKKTYLSDNCEKIFSSENYKIYTKPTNTKIKNIKNIKYKNGYFLCDIEYNIDYLRFNNRVYDKPKYMEYKLTNWLKKTYILKVTHQMKTYPKKTEISSLPFSLSYDIEHILYIQTVNGDMMSDKTKFKFTVPSKPYLSCSTHKLSNNFIPKFNFKCNKNYKYKIVCLNTMDVLIYDPLSDDLPIAWGKVCDYLKIYKFYLVALKDEIESEKSYIKIYEKPVHFLDKISV